jgi:glycosyltransferase involved in cell wall biosynthesis
MRLSIITVNLNNREGLSATLDSVNRQQFRDFEHLVIDGGSSDGSVDLLSGWTRRLAYWCAERDAGVFNAMNKGISKARGEYLLFLNSGDCLNAESTLSDVFREPRAEDILYGDSVAVGRSGASRVIYPDPLTLEQLYIASIGHQSSFIRRALFEGHPYNESARIASDWEFFLERYIEGRSFRHLQLVVARFDTRGISNRPELNMLQRRERLIVLERLLAPEKMRECEANVALAQLPLWVRPLISEQRTLLCRLFRCGRLIRCWQSQLRCGWSHLTAG